MGGNVRNQDSCHTHTLHHLAEVVDNRTPRILARIRSKPHSIDLGLAEPVPNQQGTETGEDNSLLLVLRMMPSHGQL